MLKATPVVEAGERYVFVEASNEARDIQNERVLTKALADSADYFLKYGNLDLDHLTQIGPQLGIEGYEKFEIGRPVAVKVDGKATFVKGQIFRGEGPIAERANMFWDSLTKLDPPQRWYPSVGGAFPKDSKLTVVDPDSQQPLKVITKVRWTNLGFSKTPVNSKVPHAQTVPFGVLAKSLTAQGFALDKALTAGSAVANMTGGGALRGQSLQGAAPANYQEFREALAGALRRGTLRDSSARGMAAYAVSEWGLPSNEVSEWVERFVRDMNDNLKRRMH
jgi:hypothetical protein